MLCDLVFSRFFDKDREGSVGTEVSFFYFFQRSVPAEHFLRFHGSSFHLGVKYYEIKMCIRDSKKRFAEMAKIILPAFDENILTDVVEITWATPTNNGILLFSPEEMKTFEALSPAAVIKLKIDGYRDNKYYSLALSSMKKNRIFSIEDGAPVVWLMPDVTQTQFLIEQTARIIMKMKEEKR